MIATVAQAAPFTSLGSVDLKERELMVDLLILTCQNLQECLVHS